MYRIPHIRAVGIDKRLTPIEIEALLAKTSLAGKRAVADAFAEAGLLSDSNIKAAASVDSNGRYPVTAIDEALAKCSLPVAARIEIKNTLARYSLLK